MFIKQINKTKLLRLSNINQSNKILCHNVAKKLIFLGQYCGYILKILNKIIICRSIW